MDSAAGCGRKKAEKILLSTKLIVNCAEIYYRRQIRAADRMQLLPHGSGGKINSWRNETCELTTTLQPLTPIVS